MEYSSKVSNRVRNSVFELIGYAMPSNKHDMSKFNPERLSNEEQAGAYEERNVRKRKQDTGFITRYKVIIAIGTVLEGIFTFWLFLCYWLTYPIRKLWK